MSEGSRVKVGYTDDGTHTPIYVDIRTGMIWFGCSIVPMEAEDG